MLRLIKWLRFGHEHTWETILDGVVYSEDCEFPVGSWWLQKCETCGQRRGLRS